MLHKMFDQALATCNFFKQKIDSFELKVCLGFKLFKNF